jgi:hypothetical protein
MKKTIIAAAILAAGIVNAQETVRPNEVTVENTKVRSSRTQSQITLGSGRNTDTFTLYRWENSTAPVNGSDLNSLENQIKSQANMHQNTRNGVDNLRDTKADKVDLDATNATVDANKKAQDNVNFSLQSGITNETNRATAAENNLQKQISSESSRAQAAELAITREARQIGAMAMAAAAAAGATPVGDRKTAISAAVGTYAGYSALSIGASHIVNPRTKMFGSVTSSNGGTTGAAVGVSFSF